MRNTPLRVVIIGAGFFGKKRLDACLTLPHDFTVIGVVDTNLSNRKHIEQIYHLPTAASFATLPHADVAIIATPNTYHATLCVDAMKRGAHILCEKPLATSAREAKRIVAAAKKYHRIVKTGSNHRFFHTVQKAAEIVTSGAIGDILFLKGSIGTNGARVSNKWFWDVTQSGGGTLIDNGCHLLDLARMFMGDFSQCSASISTNMWKQSTVEDIGIAIFTTKDHRQAIISSSWIQWAGYLRLELWGSKGYIIIDSTTHDTVTTGGKDGTFVTYDYSNEQKDSYHRELVYFANCIRTNIQPIPNAVDGAIVISMIDAAYLASKQHLWVPIT